LPRKRQPFFNTELLKGGLTIPQAQAVTGHKSDRMTEWYCHFDPSEFAKAKQVQETLLRPESEKSGESGAATPEGKAESGKESGEAAINKAGRVLPFPAQKTNKKRKRA
jgi:hypothetical protein